MKKPIYFFLVPLLTLPLILLFSCKKDQLEAEVVLVSVPSAHDINAILFIDENTGFMAGGDKYSSRDLSGTTDGGLTWHVESVSGGDNKSLYALSYNGQQVYAAGYDGKILIRQPGGAWESVQTDAWEWFQQIQFTGQDKGFVCAGEGYRAGRLYRTDATGRISLVDSFEFQLADVRFADATLGYACGYGAVLRSSDGGDSWQLLDVQGDFFKSISCIGSTDIWIAGYNGSIFHSGDAGRSWERQRDGNNPLLKKYRLRAILFRDRHTGYAAGDGGLLLKTTDGGEHWSEFRKKTDKDLKCMSLHPDGSLWVGGAGGTVLHILDQTQ